MHMPKRKSNIGNMTALVAALESGTYPQAQKRLRVQRDDGTYGYCCAGVACDISGTGAWEDDGTYACGGTPAPGESTETVRSGYTMPRAVCDWLGLAPGAVLRPSLPVLDENGSAGALGTDLNDSGKDFAYIAARLRATYLD